MELCTSHRVINLQNRSQKSLHLHPVLLRRTLSPSFRQTTLRRVKAELRLRKLSLRATYEETSTGKTEYAEGTQGAGVTFEEASPAERITKEGVEPEKLEEEYSPDDQSATLELLEKLHVKLDTDTTIPILLYSGGAIVSIWLALAVVGAIDAIPVLPKLMQVVGIAYSVWFTSRYLIFKESRDELSTTIAELKLKILGSEWN